jgi:CYTH domain-containing protein
MIERELKFIVINDDWKKNIVAQHTIVQYYISDEKIKALDINIDDAKEKLEVPSMGLKLDASSNDLKMLNRLGISAFRVRLQDNQPVLTIKSKKLTSDSVVEIEALISKEIFDRFAAESFCCIQKERYMVLDQQRTWEVDVFAFGLVMAEIELNADEEISVVPEWCGENVTSDKRYTNLSLAQEYSYASCTTQMLG